MQNKEYKKGIGQKLYYALIKRYESKIYEAKSVLSVYFTSSVGIGEQSQILEEMDKYITIIANAEDKKTVDILTGSPLNTQNPTTLNEYEEDYHIYQYPNTLQDKFTDRDIKTQIQI